MRVYNVRNRQAFLAPLQQMLGAQQGMLPAAAGMDAAGSAQPSGAPAPGGMPLPPALQALMGLGAPMMADEMGGGDEGPFFPAGEGGGY